MIHFGKPLRALGLIFFVALVVPAHADELRGILHNNQGVKSGKDKKAFDAYNRFNAALADLPYSPHVHYNLGNSFLENKEYAKALSEYQQALKYASDQTAAGRQLRFYALFNSGVAQTELKQNDLALALYQAALDLNPKSIETKTNIELLAQQGGGGQGQDKNQDKEPNKDQNKDQGKDPKDNKDPKDGKDPKNPPPNQDKQDQKKGEQKPKPFQSKELNQQDVNRILEELKRQEDSIREKMQKEGPKDAPRDKDW